MFLSSPMETESCARACLRHSKSSNLREERSRTRKVRQPRQGGPMWPTLGQLAHASSARKPKNAETFPSALVNHEHARCLSPQSGALLRACRSKAGIAAPETRFFSLRKNTSTLPHPKSRISWTYVNRIYKKDRQVHFVQNKLS